MLAEKTQKQLGQYFTPESIANFMISLTSMNKNAEILEPSCGEGIFIDLLQEKGFENVVGYEIDSDLRNYRLQSQIVYKSFVSEKFDRKFDIIIGNPPYIRWKNLPQDLKNELNSNALWNRYFNSLCDYLYIFILKSVELLKENGELIFITPEYWLNTTHSQTLRNYLVENGTFERIYHFNETPIFDSATVSTVIFKYVKNGFPKQSISSENTQNKVIQIFKYDERKKPTQEVLNNIEQITEKIEIEQFKKNERWIFAPEKERNELKSFEIACKKKGSFSLFGGEEYATIGEICDIGNGMVSGMDKAFQLNGEILNEFEKQALIKVVKAKDIQPFICEAEIKYIFIRENIDESEFAEKYPAFYKKLKPLENELLKRYDYNRQVNYWEWAFLRNYNLFSKPVPKIFVPCKERISHKSYFRFALASPEVYPTQDVTAIYPKESTKESIYYLLAWLNSPQVFLWLKYNGIIKGNIVEFSEKPISSIPVRLIDWNEEKEVKWYEEVVRGCLRGIENSNNIPLNVNTKSIKW
jgi:adenine-specific DNA-methyltransferase